MNAGYQHRNPKPSRQPYYSTDDGRLGWLENDFLGYLDEWEENAQKRPLLGSVNREKMLLSKPTRSGLRMATKSMVAIIRETLAAGARFVLPRRINQDPLESYFGDQRQRGHRAGNPTVSMFSANARSLDLFHRK